jgi:Kef-type K+ transport system membrane component KefB
MIKQGKILKIVAFYFIIVLGSIATIFYINNYGKILYPRSFFFTNNSAPHYLNNVVQVLLALTAVIVVARVMGFIFSLIRQPAVIGEVIGGILIGPSLLGRFFPEVSGFLLPQTVMPFFEIIAQIGIILYMFLVGLELDLKVFRRSGHAMLAISHASIVLPFILGSLLALYIFPTLAPADVNFTSFSLFLGVSMSVTAFPVLARILADQNLHKTKLGAIALTCAAIDDVTAWCLLAFVVSIAQETMSRAVYTLVLTVFFILIMMIFVKPLMRRAVHSLEKFERVAEGPLALFCLGILISAIATEYIGIHAIFGAFMFGAIIPHHSKAAVDLNNRLQDLIRVLFLPAFFAYTGMRTQISLVSTMDEWATFGMILLLAIIGKFGGTFLAARFTGISWRESAALGVLMNTRGLVELIVLNIGLDLHLISPTLFTMMVMMALATTFMTGPILQLLLGRNYKDSV